MKYLSFLPVTLLLFVLQSCNKIDDLNTIDLNSDLQKSYTADITANDPLTVNETFSVDAGSDDKIKKYLDHIQNYKVNKITYKIQDYSGASGITLTGNLNFGSVSIAVEDLDLQAASTAGTEYELTLSQADLDAIAADMKDGNSISGSLEGSVSGKPVTFTVVVTISVTVTAEVV
jgi:hypothetical protein